MSRRNLQHSRVLVQMGATKEDASVRVANLFPKVGSRTDQKRASAIAKFLKKVK